MNRTSIKARLGQTAAYLSLLLVSGLFVWNNLQWDKAAFRYWLFISDSPLHLFSSYRLYACFLHSAFPVFLKQLLHPWGYPPLVYLVSLPFYSLLGVSFETAMISQGVFVVILAFSLYGCGKKLWGRGAGILAAFLVLSFPGIQLLGKYYMLDLPLAAMVSLGFYFYLKSEHFENLGYALGFGAAFFLGLLTREQVVFYFFGLFIYEIIYLLLKNRGHRRAWGLIFTLLSGNLGLNLLGLGGLWPLLPLWAMNLAFLLLLLWLVARLLPGEARKPGFNVVAAYFLFIFPASGFIHLCWPQLSSMWNHSFAFERLGLFQGWQSPGFMLVYLNLLPGSSLLGPGMFLLPAGALLFSLLKRDFRGKAGVILAILSAGYLLLSGAPVIRFRFFAPFLPFCALLSAGFLVSLKSKPPKVILLAGVLCLGLVQWGGWRFPGIFPHPGEQACIDNIERRYDIKDFLRGENGLDFSTPASAFSVSLPLQGTELERQISEIIYDIDQDAALEGKFPGKVPVWNRLDPQNPASRSGFSYASALLNYREGFFSPYSPQERDFDYLVVLNPHPVEIAGLQLLKKYLLPGQTGVYRFKKIKDENDFRGELQSPACSYPCSAAL